ncbi:MAG: PilZ domain-containing protein [Minwuia sp.]|uniref:PilZ domain-containing protein n=1 Tax=Minwuia sp. TaxID=2493630 RepID=UPI003A8B61DE
MSVINQIARRLKQINLLFNPPPELRREHKRYEIEAVLGIVVDNGEEGAHVTTDISHGGVFVEPQVPAEPGSEVRVSVGSLLRDAPATVVVHRGGGSALRFNSVVHGAALTAWLINRPGADLKH